MWSFLLLRKRPHLIKHLYIILVIYCLIIILCGIRGVRTYYTVIGETYRVFSDVEERSGQVTGKSVSGGKIVRGSDENRKHVSGPGHLAPKSGSNYKISSINRNSKASVDSRKQLSSNSGNGLGRPLKMPVSTIGNKSLAPDMKNPVNGVHKALSSKLHSASGAQKPLSSKLHSVNGVQKPLSSKLHSVLPKQSVEQRNSLREQNKPKMISKQPVASTKVQV